MNTEKNGTQTKTVEDYQKILEDIDKGMANLPENLISEIRVISENKVAADSYYSYINVLNQQVRVTNSNHVG